MAEDLVATSTGARPPVWRHSAKEKPPLLKGALSSPFTILVWLLALVVAVLIIYPTLRVLIGLIWVDGRFSFASLRETASVPHLGETILDTALVTVSSGFAALVIGSIFAWLNERTNARMGVVTDVLPIINFLIPVVATSAGWLFLLSPRAGFINWAIRQVLGMVGIDLTTGPLSAYSWYTVIMVYTISMVPFVFLVMSAGIRNLDSSLEEQARICGSEKFAILFTVTLPSLRGHVLGALFLCTWFGLAVFSIPVILADPAGIQLISVRIVKLLSYTYPPQTGAAIGLGAMIMLVLGTVWLLQLRALRGKRIGVLGGKGIRMMRIELGAWRWPARAAMLGYLVVAVVLPLIALLLVSLNGYWSTDINWRNLSLRALKNVFTVSQPRLAIEDSLGLAVITATAGMIIAACLAWLSARSPGWLSGIAGFITKLPAAVSTIVIGVGFILAFAGPPFMLGGTLLILLLAYVVISLPEAAVTAEAAVAQIGGELREASHISGAGSARTFVSVYLPLMLPGLAAGWALVFIRSLSDLEASAMLASTSTTTIGFELLAIFNGGGSYEEMASLALVVAFCSTLVLSAVLLGTARMRRLKR